MNTRAGTFLRGFSSLLPALCAVLFLAMIADAQDVAGSKDPAGMKRYEGSELIGYRAPKFDEYLLPLGAPTSMAPPVYAKSKQTEGLVSYYTYLAPEGRTPTELFRNYKQEFQRLGIQTLYEKNAGQAGWFGPTLDKVAEDSDLSQILAYLRVHFVGKFVRALRSKASTNSSSSRFALSSSSKRTVLESYASRYPGTPAFTSAS